MSNRKYPAPNDWVIDHDAGMSHVNDVKFDRIEKALDKINERLAILEEPTPERLEAFKQLQDAYKKYKFLDELCGPHDDGSED